MPTLPNAPPPQEEEEEEAHPQAAAADGGRPPSRWETVLQGCLVGDGAPAAIAAAVVVVAVGWHALSAHALLFLVLLVPTCLVTVPKGQRVLLRSRLTGDINVLEQGLHVVVPWSSAFQGPWARLGASKTTCPAPGSRVVLDPPPSQIHTKQQVPGSVDVAVECRVGAWSQAQVVTHATVPFETNANRRINRWLCRTLEGLPADQMTFGRLSAVLNAPDNLRTLNGELGRSFCLKAECVHLDPDGVRLAPQHVAQRQQINLAMQQVEAGKQQMQRQADVAAARRRNEKAELEFQLHQEQLQQDARIQRETAEAKHKVEMARLAAEAATQSSQAHAAAVAQLLAAGLLPTDVAALKVAEQASAAVRESGATTTLLAVPPGMLGLHGLAGIKGHFCTDPQHGARQAHGLEGHGDDPCFMGGGAAAGGTPGGRAVVVAS